MWGEVAPIEDARDRQGIDGHTGGMSKGFREPDFAQVVTDRATSDTIQRIIEQDAAQAEHARERLAKGAFGVCEDCSQPIGAERLEVLPDATRCVRCQSAWDQANPLP
jgi:RNA polymerase-binding transcription factor DksA